MEPKSSSGAGGLRESLRERFGRVLEGPRGSQRLPQERPGAPQETQNEPQAGQSELREVPGVGQDFRGIFKQRVATETLPTQIAGEGA